MPQVQGRQPLLLCPTHVSSTSLAGGLVAEGSKYPFIQSQAGFL